jgi:hypothetical protein
MSFILDALNRSESDRDDAGDVPGLQTVYGTRDPVPDADWRRFLWPALALLFAVLAVLAWWSSQAPNPPPPPAPAATPGTAPAPDPAPPVPAMSEPQSARDPAADRDVAALYDATVARAPAPPPASKPAVKPASTPAQGTAAPAAAKAAPAAAEEPGIDVAALARAAQAELEDLQAEQAPVVEHAAPFVGELRQSAKDEIPSIFYSQHNWSSNPSERSVVLNGQERREGQQVKPGLRLVEILEQSIVLNFNGTEFQLRSLNSWVNL